MGFITSIISFVLCAVLYVRMVRREVPAPISKKQAWVPVALGILGPLISSAAAIGIGMLIFKLRGGEITADGVVNMPEQNDMSLPLKSILIAFRSAGFTEELVKLLLALLMVKVFKPKNVYEFALAFIGIGFGFTALEEVLYSSGGIILLIRLPVFAMHMVLGIIMGVNLGLSRYQKQNGGNGGKYIFLGLFLPVLWHTLYDAATAFNAGIDAADESTQSIAFLIAVVSIIISTVLEIILLIRFKKNAVSYCEMELKYT